ncbi:hypothetical protein M3649_19330 [Ureibacillus chungkukjangi]|uniref:hypothetical protein n=1 Tax=Ureibacillus chungkukjangi TaxID=1202712 RepID=UPI00203E07AA|nr:hypothetical protein [Ureibacillus chungkukjangi]MCM3390254.1 hypothetical protein [Ureibacillus chungkukjangi]
MEEKYSLNAETFKYILEFEKTVSIGKEYSKKELVELFRNSMYHKSLFDTYIQNAINKSIWYAVKRSGKWALVKKGIYSIVKNY